MKKFILGLTIGATLALVVTGLINSSGKAPSAYGILREHTDKGHSDTFAQDHGLDHLDMSLHYIASMGASPLLSINDLPQRNAVWEWHGSSDYVTLPIFTRATARTYEHEYVIITGTVQFVRGGPVAPNPEIRLVIYDFPTHGAPRRVAEDGRTHVMLNGNWIDDVDPTSGKQIRAEARDALQYRL